MAPFSLFLKFMDTGRTVRAMASFMIFLDAYPENDVEKWIDMDKNEKMPYILKRQRRQLSLDRKYGPEILNISIGDEYYPRFTSQ